jgi:hypothetical protein
MTLVQLRKQVLNSNTMVSQYVGMPSLASPSNNNMQSEILEKALWATQTLHHTLHPRKAERDGRHDQTDFLMQYDKGPDAGPQDEVLNFAVDGTVYVLNDDHIASERCGVSHLIHCWPEQGQKNAVSSLLCLNATYLSRPSSTGCISPIC